MRNVPTTKKPTSIPYYVYDNYITEITGTPVVEKNGERTIMLTPAQAQYLMDAGSIGLIPASELSTDAKKALGQMHKTEM